ncbi:MAG: 50S ribosomal protein L11 methyltransferase [Kangiellaceae bacterium]|jgi:hypothetical protein|nr:50S ribosomal protein L11 methyltransferase [Kangiellaceae bacterium]
MDNENQDNNTDAGDWKDIAWKEYDYHAGDGAHTKADVVPIASLFSQDGDEEWDDDDMEFRFKGLIHTIRIRGESLAGNTKVFQSTGLAVWSGGDELANYLIHGGSHFIRGKRVLELGSGTGIGGIIAHHVGASSVIWTDGDLDALENLRHNVAQNVCNSDTKEESKNGSQTTLQYCPQLIWGHELDKFREKYGVFDVILASDCIYMSKCVGPFWETVDSLLMANQPDYVQDCVLIYVNTCVSQAPFQVMEAEAYNHGFFECKTTSANSIHIFRRAQAVAS